MGKPEEAGADTWMGTNNGHSEGETLVIDVTGLNGLAWFDRAGDFASNQLHVVERYARVDPYRINHEATIEDPSVFTRTWKISIPLYKVGYQNARLLDFKCVEYSEELLYGAFKKQPVPPSEEGLKMGAPSTSRPGARRSFRFPRRRTRSDRCPPSGAGSPGQ
jgi:hypothetical protein